MVNKMEEKSVLDILREKNEKGELPKKFTEEELLEIYFAETTGMGCAFCPMGCYSITAGEIKVPEKDKEEKENKDESTSN